MLVTAGDYTKLRAVRVTLPKGVKIRRVPGGRGRCA